MEVSNPAKSFLEGFFIVIFIYICYELIMWYLRTVNSTSPSGSTCGCGKKKLEYGKESHTVVSLRPSQKACIAVGICQNPNKSLSEIHEWKVAIVRGADRIFGKEKADIKSKPKSRRRK